MKTPDEYMNEFSADTTTKGRVKAEDAIKAIRAAVKDACREQREICAARYNQECNDYEYSRRVLEAIKNAPEPKF